MRSARRLDGPPRSRLRSLLVHWFFTGLLIAASAGTVAWTGHLLRRLFTTEPDAAEPAS